MRINQNISALNAWRNLQTTDSAMSKSLERLSSGLRINRAADDAAGLAISEKMRGQIKGLNQATRNAQDAISLIQTAEGALNETHSILQRMRELANQAASDTNTIADRWQIQREVNQLSEELTRISGTTEFNTKKLLDGSFNGTFQIGANADQNISVAIANMSSAALGTTAAAAVTKYDAGTTNFDASSASNDVSDLKTDHAYTVEVDASGSVTLKGDDGTVLGTGALADAGTSVTITITAATATDAQKAFMVDPTTDATVVLAISDTDSTTGIATKAGTIGIYMLGAGQGISVLDQSDANDAIKALDSAISRVSSQRSSLGAVQNRLEHTIANLSTAAENLSAAESRIRDVDMAAEMAAFTRSQILLQAGTAMMAQANQKPQSVLQLLR